MNICHIGSYSYTSEKGEREIKAIGGISGYIYDLVSYLLIANHHVVFVGKIYFFNKQKNLVYKEVQRNPSSTNRFLLALFFKSFFIKLPKDTIIHAHRPDHLATFAWFRKNASVLTLHGQQSRTVNSRKGLFIRWIYCVLEYIALKRVDIVLATDKITEQYYLFSYPWLRCKLRVLPTGIDTNVFKKIDKNQCREFLHLDRDAKILMYIGRIEPPKRVNDIITAFKHVYKVYPNTKLIIIGDGVLLNEMKQQVVNNNLGDSVKFTGIVIRNDLPFWINAADLTILYSYNEGSPLSIKESLACGVPVIANKVGDIEEVIINGINGFVIEQEDNMSISKIIEMALYEYQFDSKVCVESIKKYSLENVNKKIESVYREL